MVVAVEELKIYETSRISILGEWHQPPDVTKVPDKNDPFADPSTVAIRIHRPDGTLDEFVYGVDTEIVRDSVGKYRCVYIVPLAGGYTYSWMPTGNAAQPADGDFYAHAL